MSDADLPSIAAREEAATPGPWIASHESVSDIHGFDCQSQVTYPDGHGNYGFTPADAEFIAHARQDIPTLLAALAESRERLEGVERERDEAQAKMGSLQAQADVAFIRIEAAEQWRKDRQHDSR